MRQYSSAVVHRTGTEYCTITDAHSYHTPVGTIDYKGTGHYVMGYNPHCPLCRQEAAEEEHAVGHHPA
jgi:hypothetical protein